MLYNKEIYKFYYRETVILLFLCIDKTDNDTLLAVLKSDIMTPKSLPNDKEINP